MAVRFLDSFSHYGTSNITQKWTGTVDLGRGSRSIVVGGGRCKQNCLQLSANTIGSGDGPALHLPYAGLTSGTMSAGYRLAGDNFNTPGFIFSLYRNGTMYGDSIAGLAIESNGALVAHRGAFGTGSSTYYQYSLKAISDTAWHHIAWSFTIDPVVGRFIVYVDGDTANPWIDFTGNTGSSGGYTDLSVLRYNSVSGGGTTQQMCDFFWGDAITDYKGDTRVYARLPNADGAMLQWTPSVGSQHFVNVDENPPDNGVTYNYNTPTGTGNIDTYKFPAIGIPSGTVYAVQVVPMLAKTDVGFRSAATVIRQGGVNYTNATAMAVADGQYLYYPQCYEQDPTSASWTVSTAVNDEFGICQTG